MNKLFIIGNGFDLAHGLKTSYNDFIVWYFNNVFRQLLMSSEYHDDFMIYKRNKPIIKRYIEINHTSNIPDVLNENKISFRSKHEILYIIFNRSLKDWVEIENIYYVELIKIVSAFNSSNDNSKENIRVLNYYFEKVKYKLIEYLLTIDSIKDTPVINAIRSAFENEKHRGNGQPNYTALFINF